LSKEGKEKNLFYGWIVVAACFGVTLTLGEAMWTFGVFFKPLEREFGWNRALVSSGYTAFLIGFGVSAIISGRLADKYSPRPILFVSALLAGIGTSLCSQAHSINQLRIFLLIGGLGGGATWSVPVPTVQRWFNSRPKAGLALSTVVSGVGVGGLIFAPFINHLILRYGWRNTYLVVGIIYFIVITIAAIVIKPSPQEDGGLLTKKGQDLRDSTDINLLSASQAALTTCFVGITFVHCSVVLSFQIMAVHLIPYATDVGISPTVSAGAVGLLGGLSVPGRFFSGLVVERVSWQKLLAGSLFGMGLSLPLLLFLQKAWMLYCFVLFFGICHGCRSSSHVGLLGEFFGMRPLGTLIGITTAMGMLVGAFAPYAAGFIFDVTGSYFVVLTILMGMLLIGGTTASLVKGPVHRMSGK